MTTQDKKPRDFSRFNSYNNEPCAEDEILYPVVCDEGMRRQLEADGLVRKNVVSFPIPGAKRRVPVAFIRIREDQRQATEAYFNLQVHLYLQGDSLFGDGLLSLDEIMRPESEDEDEIGYDPTGSNAEVEKLDLKLSLDEVYEKLLRLDPLYAEVYSLLRQELSQKEILQRIGWGKSQSQGYALIDKVRRLAKDLCGA